MNYKNILTKKFLIQQYIKNKKSTYKIAEETNIPSSTIYNYLINYSIKIRTVSQARKLQHIKVFGKDNSNYRHGETLKKHYCIDCGKEISSYQHKRCKPCASKIMGLIQKEKGLSKGNKNGMFGVHRFGKEAPNWQGGVSFIPYPLGWTKTFKEYIRYRDGYKCQICGCPEVECNRKLDVHHKDYNKENLDPNNLISLCHRCNIIVNYNRDYWFAYFCYKLKIEPETFIINQKGE